jgi:hypothetical protein
MRALTAAALIAWVMVASLGGAPAVLAVVVCFAVLGIAALHYGQRR